jgi:hypothetical protein
MDAPSRTDDSGRDEPTDESAESTLHHAVSLLVSHWQATLFAAASLGVAYWAEFYNDPMSPKWYVPIMLTFALGALGYIYLTAYSSMRIGGAEQPE